VSNWLFDGTIWVPQGIQIPLNEPAINIATSGNPQVLISNQLATIGGQTLSTGGVGVYFWPDSAQSANNSNGALSMTYPAPAFATSTVNSVNPSLIVNGTQLNQGLDPDINPMEWQTYPTAGTTTAGSYITLPYPTGSTSYQMAVLTQLVIPKAGAYNVTFVHDDGAFFGFGTGVNSGAAPSSSETPGNIPWQIGAGGGTIMANYPILFGNNVAGF